MASKKNQHFLPQFYFRQFSTNRKNINLILRNNGKIIKGASIKGQCSKNNFYGDESIEEAFSKIEGKHSGVLKRIESINSSSEFTDYYNDFDPEIHNDIKINPDILVLLEMIAFQRNRTEFEAKKLRTSLSKLYKEFILAELEAGGDESTLKYKDAFEIEMDETIAVLMQIEIAMKSIPAILDMGIYLLQNKTEVEFIFSDSPVVFYNKAYRDIKGKGVLGLQSPGLLIFFPISAEKCILLIDEEKYCGEILGKNFFEIENKFDIDSINKLQLHHSLNSIYFSDNTTEKYIKKIWRQQKTNFIDILGVFNKGDFFDKDGKRNGEVMHLYQKQVPFNLSLSFLDSVDLSGERRVANYRNKELMGILNDARTK